MKLYVLSRPSGEQQCSDLGLCRSWWQFSAVAPLQTECVIKSLDLTVVAAFRANGSLVTWGDADPGGVSRAVAQLMTACVIQVFGPNCFRGLQGERQSVTWGNADLGGDPSAVAPLLMVGVIQVCGTFRAFAAIMENGSVVTWGSANLGGDSSAVAPLLTEGFTQVFGPNCCRGLLGERQSSDLGRC